MKKRALPVVAFLVAGLLAAVGPASAQLGGISGVLKGAQTAKKISDIKMTDAEEQQLGQQVSDKVVETFGVHQDAEVARYVALVGTVLAKSSTRPNLNWQFVVLDTEGVNAFAAPGGYVHITKGLLGLLKTEAELAGVLAHEVIHITEKHTVKAIQKNDSVAIATGEVGGGGLAQSLVTKLAEAAYKNILNNEFSRDDEGESDDKGIQLANKIGYAPSGLSSALSKLADRNKNVQEKNGLFASHPAIKERITTIEKAIRDKKLGGTATVQARYAKYITFDAKPAAELATVAEGSRGLTGGTEKSGSTPADTKTTDGKSTGAAAEPKPEAKAEPKKEEKKGGGLLGRLRPSGGKQAEQSQTVASAGARGLNPDRDAVGGANKKRVPVKIGPNDIAEFQKGIVA